MKSLLLSIFSVLATISLVSAEVGQSSYYGTISTLEDCEKFNNNEQKEIARAIATGPAPSRNSAFTWRILGANSKKFNISECFKKITNPRKTIIFHVTKDFDKLKAFPRGPAWLQVNVAKGPNVDTEPHHFPTMLDDAAFEAVVFGLSESETGVEESYTKEQIDRLLRFYNHTVCTAERFVQLNSALLERSSTDALRSLADQASVKVMVYQEKEAAVDGKKMIDRLGAKDVNFLLDVGMRSYFKREAEEGEDASEVPTDAPTEAPTEPPTTMAPVIETEPNIIAEELPEDPQTTTSTEATGKGDKVCRSSSQLMVATGILYLVAILIE